MLIHPLQSTRSYNLSRKLILSDFLSGVIFFFGARFAFGTFAIYGRNQVDYVALFNGRNKI